MADLQFHISDFTHIPNCVMVKMAGAIDATTVLTFQSTLENLQLNGVTRFILDMEGIKYVNSTGLGSLVRLADQLENEGGGFALVKIHPKVKVVFDMLGLNAFFKIFGNLDEAVAYFKQTAGSMGSAPGGHAPAQQQPPPRTPQTAPPPPPPPPAARSRQAIPPPPPPPPRNVQPPPPSPAAPATYNPRQTGTNLRPQTSLGVKTGGAVEPRAITCQNCGVTLKIAQAGTFKCSRCFTVFTVNPAGAVEFTRTSRPTPLQMNLTCGEECREGLLLFLGAVARRTGFDANRTNQLQQAVSEVVGHITSEAYGNNPQNTYSVLIAPVAGEMNIKFADHGRAFDSRNPNLFRFTKSVMSSFDLKPHPQGGNIVTLKMGQF